MEALRKLLPIYKIWTILRKTRRGNLVIFMGCRSAATGIVYQKEACPVIAFITSE